ncbi:efflux RND transporter periplasmic adaptor subunit [Leptothrix ochracea]|uniref:efflux RND transporter periplasmic adaptor subunit n=1 Tax=Leptothrix ochracea TaxID=735331 RepID=UPI0034E22C65
MSLSHLPVSFRMAYAGRALLVVSALILAACGDSGGAGGAGGGGAAAVGAASAGASGAAAGMGAGASAPAMPPPPAVGVITVQPTSVALATDLPGRLEAWRTAQVRARVPGIVHKRLFNEGGLVKAGQSLFQLDASLYRATLDSAQAAQAKAEANLAQARATFERNEPLVAAKAISQTEWVGTQTALKLAEADVATAKASVQTAKLNLEYAAVQAPINGRIGRSLVTEGALVGQGEATLLATIQQTDLMYVNFTQPASEVLRLRRAFESGQLKRVGAAGGGGAELKVVLDDGSEYARPGKLLFSDLTVDATSGQVTLRAEVPNPDGVLLPGLFVKVRLALARTDAGILVPQQAVTRAATGDTVLVVGEGNMPMPRPVKIGSAQGSQWVVLDGLKPGEQVIVDGFQKMRPKSPVRPVPWTPGGAAPSAPAASVAPASAPSASAAASR